MTRNNPPAASLAVGGSYLLPRRGPGYQCRPIAPEVAGGAGWWRRCCSVVTEVPPGCGAVQRCSAGEVQIGVGEVMACMGWELVWYCRSQDAASYPAPLLGPPEPGGRQGAGDQGRQEGHQEAGEEARGRQGEGEEGGQEEASGGDPGAPGGHHSGDRSKLKLVPDCCCRARQKMLRPGSSTRSACSTWCTSPTRSAAPRWAPPAPATPPRNAAPSRAPPPAPAPGASGSAAPSQGDPSPPSPTLPLPASATPRPLRTGRTSPTR